MWFYKEFLSIPQIFDKVICKMVADIDMKDNPIDLR